MSSRRILPRIETSDQSEEADPISNDFVVLDVVLPRPVSPGGVYLEQLKARSLETYLPRSGTALLDLKKSWQWSIRRAGDLGPPLNTAFAALNLIRLGLVHQHQEMTSQGRSYYGVALASIQHALNTPELAFQDKTLAAMRTLSIYEHLSPTFAPTPPGRVHEIGLEQWCAAAGPQNIRTDLALDVFQDVRWSIMSHSIDRRKSSILGSGQWKDLPWRRLEKDSLQQLFDIGFDLAAVLEQIDVNNVRGDNEPKQTRRADLWSSCFEIFRQLEQWFTLHWARHTHQQDSLSDENLDVVSAEQLISNDPLNFGTFWEATNLVYYWSFKLILDENILSLSEYQARSPSSSTKQRSASISPSVPRIASSSRHSTLAVEGLSAQQRQQIASTSLKLAVDIVRAAPSFLADETGWLGPQRLFFPLRRAMQHLGKVQSPLFRLAHARFMEAITKLRSQCGDKT